MADVSFTEDGEEGWTPVKRRRRRAALVTVRQTKSICCFTDPAGEFPRDAKLKIKMGVVNINGRGLRNWGVVVT